MNRIYFFFLLFAVVTGCSTVPKVNPYVTYFPDKSVYDIPKLLEENTGMPAVCLQKITEAENGAKSDFEAVTKRSKTHLILDPKSKAFSSFIINDKKNNVLKDIFLRVIYPDNEILEIRKEDLRKENNDDGSIVYKYAYPNLTKGTIIQEYYEYTSYSSKYHFMDFKSNVPILEYKYNLLIPDQWKISFKNYNRFKDFITKIELKNERKTQYTIRMKNIPAFEEEPYSISLMESQSYLLSKITSYFLIYFAGEICCDTHNDPTTWEGLAQELLVLDTNSKSYPPETDSILVTIDKNNTTELAKVEAIMKFIYDNYEYDPEANPLNTLNNSNEKKGTAKQLTNLALHMAHKLNLKSYYVLCHSADKGEIDPEFIDLFNFDRPAIMFEIGDEPFFCFPYLKSDNIKKIPAKYVKQTAIILSDYNNSNRVGKFVQMPDNEESSRKIEDTYQINILANGQLKIHQTLSIEEDYMQEIRKSLQDLKDDEKDEKLEIIMNSLSLDNSNAKIDKWTCINIKDELKPLIIEVDYTIDNLVSVMKDDVLVQTVGLLDQISLNQYRVNRTIRKNPIFIRQNILYQKNVEIQYPDNWQFIGNLKPFEMTNKFGNYSLAVNTENHKVKIAQSTIIKENNAPKEEYSLLTDLLWQSSYQELSTLFFEIK